MFSVIGLSGFAFQTVLLAWLTRTRGWHYTSAVPISAEVAVLLSFLWHSAWTRRDRPVRGMRLVTRRLVRYQVVRAAGIAYSYMLTLTHGALWTLPPEVANTVSVGLVAILNFSVADRLVFETSRPEAPSSS